MTYSELVEIITDNASLPTEGIARDIEPQLIYLLDNPKPIKVITGIRRSGKSFLLKRLYKKLLSKGIPPKNILFLNFEDDRLVPYLDLKHLRKIYELFLTYADRNLPIYIFFDEIQNIAGWEKFVRTLYDSTNHNIFITGSNSQLLSGEFSQVLGGRLIEFKLYPFSFIEVLKFNEVNVEDEFEIASNRAVIKRLAENYLHFGGLPEVQNLDKPTILAYRKSLIEKIVIKDILSRYKIEQPVLFSNLIIFLERNIGNIISYKNLAKLIGVSDKTVENYIFYLQVAFIGQILSKFSWKTKEIFNRQKKFYFVDNIFTYYADLEDKLENFVYSHLVRKFDSRQIFFGREDRGKEIDFLVKTDEGKFLAIQVCYELNDENVNREIGSLLLFDKYITRKNADFVIVFIENELTTPLPQWIKAIDFTRFPIFLKEKF